MRRVAMMGSFLLAVLAAEIIIHFSIRTFAGHHPDSAAMQALAGMI